MKPCRPSLFAFYYLNILWRLHKSNSSLNNCSSCKEKGFTCTKACSYMCIEPQEKMLGTVSLYCRAEGLPMPLFAYYADYADTEYIRLLKQPIAIIRPITCESCLVKLLVSET